MLRPLVTEFKVIGNGFKTLKEIQKSYENLKNSFKKKIKNDFFSSIGSSFDKVLAKVKNGTVRVGNAFMNMRTRAETALNRINKSGSGLQGTLTKVAGIVGGGMLIKNAFQGAAELEMQRTAIASMRGEQRASELMKFGVNFANITPYQTNEVLDAVKTLEIRGLDPTKYLDGIGNMSAMLGKPLEQGVEAILDAVTGEFERLKEFGITKKMLEEKISIGSFDNKGSLINQEKMFDDLMKYINQSYAGGMEKLSKTTIGMISTIKGIYGSFTNLLFTGSQTGEIADNSPLGVFRKEVLLPLADNMIKWQENGTFTKWGTQFTDAFIKVYKIIKSSISFLWKHREAILALMSGYIAFKTTLSLINLATMLTNPVGLATLAISALAGAFIYAYRNFEPFREFVLWVGEKALDVFFRLGEIIDTAFNKPLEATKMLLSDITNLFENLLDVIIPFEDIKAEGKQSILELQGGKKASTFIDKQPILQASGILIKPQKQPQNIVVNVENTSTGTAERLKKLIADFFFEEEIRRGER